MGDPGLKSKYVESQQHDAFATTRSREPQLTPYEQRLRLDLAYIDNELRKPQHPYRREALVKARREVGRFAQR